MACLNLMMQHTASLQTHQLTDAVRHSQDHSTSQDVVKQLLSQLQQRLHSQRNRQIRRYKQLPSRLLDQLHPQLPYLPAMQSRSKYSSKHRHQRLQMLHACLYAWHRLAEPLQTALGCHPPEILQAALRHAPLGLLQAAPDHRPGLQTCKEAKPQTVPQTRPKKETQTEP